MRPKIADENRRPPLIGPEMPRPSALTVMNGSSAPRNTAIPPPNAHRVATPRLETLKPDKLAGKLLVGEPVPVPGQGLALGYDEPEPGRGMPPTMVGLSEPE
jgi:hypothetical protein